MECSPEQVPLVVLMVSIVPKVNILLNLSQTCRENANFLPITQLGVVECCCSFSVARFLKGKAASRQRLDFSSL
jgi:hypothetical protein